MCETENPEFMIFSETHLTSDVSEEEIQLKGYNQHSTLSNSTRTGGVIIYFKRNWNVKKITEKNVDSKFWLSAYVAQRGNNKFLITAAYRSPSSAEAEFIQVFEEILEELNEENCDIIIAGDFNIDWCKDSFYKNKINCLFNDNGLKQIMNEFTRITINSKTIIDYIVTNNRNIKANINSENKITDHEAIDIIMEDSNISSNQNLYKEMEIFKYDCNVYNREIINMKYINIENDINNTVCIFDGYLENAVKKLTTKTLLKTNNNNIWFNDELRCLKRQKITKYQIAKIENTVDAWNNYKSIRNIYKVKIENAKNEHINKKINDARDQKEMWREIKNQILKKSQSEIKSVIFNQIECKENSEIADKFNYYFINSIREIRESINNNVQYVNKIPVTNYQFKFRAITLDELRKVCKNLKDKADHYKISCKIILNSWSIIGEKLLAIINESMRKGVFPDNWKTAIISPIEKVAKTKKCEDFRPINTLKTCEKILEKIVKEQLQEYMEANKLLTKYQSGFRKEYSCETAVNYLINRWKKMEKNNKILAIFLDFKRAFETIDRNILLKKLYKYGIKNTELKWFESYLTNRTQITKVNNIKSNSIVNNYGVPQGSILGALLFIIYINDMPNVLNECEITLYADDTLIFVEAESIEQCYVRLNQDIEKVNMWLNMNKLKLNECKTKIMEINANSNKIFKINNEIIERVNKIKYLGFVIDQDLKFNDHTDYICKKIGKKISFFKRIRKQVSILTSINIYNTIIKPHFEFGSTILYSCCTARQIERLQKLQNKAMRTILKLNRYASINFMLDTLKWLNIKQRLELNTINFIQKIKKGEAPEYLTEQITYVREVQPYQLRNSENFRIERVSTSAMQKSLFYKGLQLYNALPNSIKNEERNNVFRKYIVYFVKQNL